MLQASLVAASLCAATAHAAVIDFDATSVAQLSHTNLPSPLNVVNVYHGTSYVEDGFQLSSSLVGTPFHSLFVPDDHNVLYRPAADSYAMAATALATVTLTSVDHSAFNVTSIDLAKLLKGPLALDGSVTFYGTKAGTSTPVVQKFDYTSSWTTFLFNANFTGLSSLSWTQGALSRYEFDNINVTTAVPEAQTWAMLLAGLGMLGWMARRKRA
jgi:hypothetical protein